MGLVPWQSEDNWRKISWLELGGVDRVLQRRLWKRSAAWAAVAIETIGQVEGWGEVSKVCCSEWGGGNG